MSNTDPGKHTRAIPSPAISDPGDRRDRLSWPVQRSIPMLLGVGATVAIAVTFVWPSLAEAERFDARRTAMENTARSLRGSGTAAERLMVERERCLALIAGAPLRIDPTAAQHLTPIADGLRRLQASGSFEDIRAILNSVDLATGFTVREFSLEREGTSDRLKLDVTLEEAAPQASELVTVPATESPTEGSER